MLWRCLAVTGKWAQSRRLELKEGGGEAENDAGCRSRKRKIPHGELHVVK